MLDDIEYSECIHNDFVCNIHRRILYINMLFYLFYRHDFGRVKTEMSL